MKKKLIPIIIAVIVLIALIITYFIVEKNFSKVDQTDIDDIFGTYEYLWEENPQNLSSVHFDIENGEYTIRVSSDDISIDGFESVITSRYELLQALRNVSVIPVERFIDVKKEDFAKYGFNDSKNIITLNFADKRVRTLVIGHDSGVDNEVYALSKEDGKVCTISSKTCESFLSSASKYRSKIICTLSNVFLRELSVHKGSAMVMSITEGDERDTYVMEYPYKGALVSGRKIGEFMSMFNQIDADAVVEENPVNLSKYGFDDGLVVYIHDSANKHTFKFGDMAPEGGMYIMYGDRPVVYRGNVFLYEIFKEVNPVEYLEPYVHLYDLSEVSRVEISKDGKKCTMTAENTGDKKNYTFNGKNIQESDFIRLYQAVAGIYYGKVTDESPSSDVYFEISFVMKDGKVNSFKYYDTGRDYCIVRTTNGYDAVVLKSIVDSVWQALLS